jgi:hypothetical protein
MRIVIATGEKMEMISVRKCVLTLAMTFKMNPEGNMRDKLIMAVSPFLDIIAQNSVYYEFLDFWWSINPRIRP